MWMYLQMSDSKHDICPIDLESMDSQSANHEDSAEFLPRQSVGGISAVRAALEDVVIEEAWARELSRATMAKLSIQDMA